MRENSKSIMFLLGRFAIGGVERVTLLLANALAVRGWIVTVVAFKFENSTFLKSLHPNILAVELSFPAYTIANYLRLRRLMRERAVRAIVNQWAFPFPVALMLRLAMKRTARLISVFHTMPGKSRRINEATGLKKMLMTYVVRCNARIVYGISDWYVVLAKSYVESFKCFAGFKNPNKICAIPNPVCIDRVCRPRNKENVILYVGRLTLTEKRVDRVIDVWSRICNRLPDWRLEILGDGPDREQLESMANDLPRISFRGFQRPDDWYMKSKLLLLTSDFEGFPMTLVEGMSNGCVPVVYGSFATAREIVPNACGVVVEGDWNVVRFSDSVLSLAGDRDRLETCIAEGMNRVREFDLSRVVDAYEQLMGA